MLLVRGRAVTWHEVSTHGHRPTGTASSRHEDVMDDNTGATSVTHTAVVAAGWRLSPSRHSRRPVKRGPAGGALPGCQRIFTAEDAHEPPPCLRRRRPGLRRRAPRHHVRVGRRQPERPGADREGHGLEAVPPAQRVPALRRAGLRQDRQGADRRAGHPADVQGEQGERRGRRLHPERRRPVGRLRAGRLRRGPARHHDREGRPAVAGEAQARQQPVLRLPRQRQGPDHRDAGDLPPVARDGAPPTARCGGRSAAMNPD
ncbi:hypothetical protein SGPA1_10067 [Streptomyces misionensis JCM 4497]